MPKSRRPLSPDTRVVLTKADVAELLRISVPSVDRLLRRGPLRRLPGVRRVLIPRSSIDQFLAKANEAAS
jgi:excisionase family DNA binding protein